jgi:hypothetical protein
MGNLLLIEAGQAMNEGNHTQAQEDYLTVVRFLKHLSQQKYGSFLAGIIERMGITRFYSLANEIFYKYSLSRDFYEGLLK